MWLFYSGSAKGINSMALMDSSDDHQNQRKQLWSTPDKTLIFTFSSTVGSTHFILLLYFKLIQCVRLFIQVPPS